MKYKALKNFAFGGRTYSVGDAFNSKGVIKLLLNDLVERGLIKDTTVKESGDA